MVKTILLTGATSGIGKAFTEQYNNNKDYFLVLLGRNEEKLKTIKTNNSRTYCVDLENQEQLDKTLSDITKNHNIDILINNAGLGIPTRLDEEELLKKYTSMMDTNVKAVVTITKEVLKQMKDKKEGQIINISSEAGLASNPVAPLYCATKYALEAYSDGLRQQLKADSLNIRVSLIRPGQVATNYWGERVVPKEKFLTSQEVAETIDYIIKSPQNVCIKSIDLESTRF
jgi:NADP-dependent 3-hydroxy acid dehydrogenase YdfG